MASKKRVIESDVFEGAVEHEDTVESAVLDENTEAQTTEMQELTFAEAVAEDQALKEQEIAALQARQTSVLEELAQIRSRLKELGVIEMVAEVTGSKMAKAKALYRDCIDQGMKRKEVVERFVTELGLSVNTANSYVQKFKHL